MIDATFDPIIFVFEVPENTPGGTVEGYSFDGDNFDYQVVSISGGETISIFIN